MLLLTKINVNTNNQSLHVTYVGGGSNGTCLFMEKLLLDSKNKMWAMVCISTNNNILLGDCSYDFEKNPSIKLIKNKFNKNTKLKTIDFI